MDESTSRAKSDHIIVVGATGTIGTEVINKCRNEGYPVVAISRSEPDQSVPSETLDFKEPGSVCNTVEALAERDIMYGGIVLCSGVDSYINSERFDADACQEVMRLNAISQIQLVSRIFQSDSFSVSTPFRAAIASSSILSEPVSDGLAYGMSKSALETGFRFLAEEKTSGSFSVSAVRLPYVGEPMGTIIGPRPEERPLPEEGVISPEEAANALCHAVTHSSNAEPWSVVEVN